MKSNYQCKYSDSWTILSFALKAFNAIIIYKQYNNNLVSNNLWNLHNSSNYQNPSPKKKNNPLLIEILKN